MILRNLKCNCFQLSDCISWNEYAIIQKISFNTNSLEMKFGVMVQFFI